MTDDLSCRFRISNLTGRADSRLGGVLTIHVVTRDSLGDAETLLAYYLSDSLCRAACQVSIAAPCPSQLHGLQRP